MMSLLVTLLCGVHSPFVSVHIIPVFRLSWCRSRRVPNKHLHLGVNRRHDIPAHRSGQISTQLSWILAPLLFEGGWGVFIFFNNSMQVHGSQVLATEPKRTSKGPQKDLPSVNKDLFFAIWTCLYRRFYATY